MRKELLLDIKNILRYNGKKLSLVLWGSENDGRDKVVVYTGTALVENDFLYFVRSEGPARILIEEGWLDRIKPVSSDLSELLNDAEFSISLTVGDIPDGEKSDEYNKTGLKWPE